MSDPVSEITKAAEFIRSKLSHLPNIGIILGTGLGNLATRIVSPVEIDYSEIPYFPISTIEFHKGRLIAGRLSGRQVLAMQGRFHLYEGYDVKQVTFPVRVMKMLGIERLLISNAAGSMNPDIKKGDLMAIDDHINFMSANPLSGKNLDEFGPRFPDMSRPYDPTMIKMMRAAAAEMNLHLPTGVYVAVPGPNLETRAEYRFLRMIGADAVGMSTVPEVIVANHMSLPVAAISVITDECDPDNLQPVNIDEIIEVAGRAEMKLTELFARLIAMC